jgi:hypothetical protein
MCTAGCTFVPWHHNGQSLRVSFAPRSPPSLPMDIIRQQRHAFVDARFTSGNPTVVHDGAGKKVVMPKFITV